MEEENNVFLEDIASNNPNPFLEEVSNRGKASSYDNQFYNSFEFTGNTRVGDSQYDSQGVPFSELENLNKIRAQRQPVIDQLGNATVRLTNIIPEAIGGIASALDFEDYFNSDEEVGNWLTSLTNEWKESTNEETPIYRENPGEALDFGDSGWWIENGSGLVNSIGGFAISGGVISKSLQGLSKLSKINKLATIIAGKSNAEKVGNISNTVINATMLNQAESIMEATNVFDSTYSYELNKLTELGDVNAESKAKTKAAKAAEMTINANRANILLNLSSANLFLKTPSLTRNLVMKETTKRNLGRGTIEGLQESAEEVINLIAGNIGKAYGEDKDYSLEAVLKNINKAEAIEAALLGFIGGFGHTVATKEGVNRINKTTDPETGESISIRDYNKKRYNKQQEVIKEYDKNAESVDVRTFTSTFENSRDNLVIQKAYKEAIDNNDEVEAERLSKLLISTQAYHAFKSGTTENLIKLYQELKDGPQKEGMDEDYKEKAEEAIKTIKGLEEYYNYSKSYINDKEVFSNRARDLQLESDLNLAERELSNKASTLSPKIDRKLKHKKYKDLNYHPQDRPLIEPSHYTPEIISDESNQYNLNEKVYSEFKRVIKNLPEYKSYNEALNKINTINKEIETNDKSFETITSDKYQGKYKQQLDNIDELVAKKIEKEAEKSETLDKIEKATTSEEVENISKNNTLADKAINDKLIEKREELKKQEEVKKAEVVAKQKEKSEDTKVEKAEEEDSKEDLGNRIGDNYNTGEFIPITRSELAQYTDSVNDVDNAISEFTGVIEFEKDNNDEFVKLIIVDLNGEEVIIPKKVTKTVEANPSRDFNTEGSVNHENLIPKKNENNLDTKDSIAQSGSKLVSTTKKTGVKFDFVTQVYLDYERTPIDKVGKEVKFEINTKDLNNKNWTSAQKGYQDLLEGKTLTKEQIDLLIKHLPINAVISEGVSTPIETLPSTKGGVDTFNKSSVILRTNIVNALIAGSKIEDISTTIEGQYKGMLQVDTLDNDNKVKENNVLDLYHFNGMTDSQKTDYIKENLTVVNDLGKFQYISGKTEDFINKGGKLKSNAKGEVYLMIPQANGKQFALKLNIQKIQEKDADLLTKLYKIRLSDQNIKKNTTINEISDNELKEFIKNDYKHIMKLISKPLADITVKDFVDFMVWDGTENIKTRIGFIGNKTTGIVLQFGNNEVTSETFNEQEFKEWLTSTKRYNIALKPKINETSLATLSTSDNYINHLFNSKIINTNTIVGENNPTFQGYSNIYLKSNDIISKPSALVITKRRSQEDLTSTEKKAMADELRAVTQAKLNELRAKGASLMEATTQADKLTIKEQAAIKNKYLGVETKPLNNNQKNSNQSEIDKIEAERQAKLDSLISEQEFIKSIFPDTKAKEIVYHGGPKNIKKFNKKGDKNYKKSDYYTDNGIYFTKNREYAESYSKRFNEDNREIYSVILNMKNPLPQVLERDKDGNVLKHNYRKEILEGDIIIGYSEEGYITPSEYLSTDSITDEDVKKIKKDGYDSIDDLTVFEPEQIHILTEKEQAKIYNKENQNKINAKYDAKLSNIKNNSQNIRNSQKNSLPLHEINNTKESEQVEVLKEEVKDKSEITASKEVTQELMKKVISKKLIKVSSKPFKEIMKLSNQERFNALKEIADANQLDVSSIITKCK